MNQNTEYAEHLDHYQRIMCLKKTAYGPKMVKDTKGYMTNCKLESGRDNLKHLCVLPKGHAGKCAHKFRSIFIRTRKGTAAKKLCDSVDKAIYTTPGNDDYVYKNRASRLYCNVLSREEEKKIRDKKIKKKCAIPKKDMSSPTFIAQAALDWFIYMFSIPGVEKMISTKVLKDDLYIDYFKTHKNYLINYFAKKNRKIFNEKGNTMCCITRNEITINDIADPERDNRVDIKDTDLQLGHNIPRSDDYITLRGCNVLPQSRKGNLIIGENIFTEDVWINQLKNIVSFY